MQNEENSRVKDPCATLLDEYLACVSRQTNGLREGEECLAEAKQYKECRAFQKKNKLSPSKEGPAHLKK